MSENLIAYAIALICFTVVTVTGLFTGHPEAIWVWVLLIFIDA